MAFIDSTALNVALPALQTDLSADGTQLLWIVNAYALFLSSLILVGGALGDIYGRKRIFGIGIGVFTVASVLCGLAPTADFLIAARAVQGIGGALMVPGSLALITASFAAERRGRAIGTWSMFSTMTTILGPVIGGALATAGLWRGVFFINLPLAVIALAALSRIPESRNENASRQLDWLGALLATLGLAGLTYGFIEAPSLGFSSPIILFALGGGVLALIAFVFVESRSSHPMMPLHLFRSRTFSGANLLTLFLYAALGGVLFFLPLNLIQVQGYSPQIAGLTLLPFALSLMFLSRFSGAWMDRVGSRLPLIIGPAITGIGFALLSLPGVSAGPSAYWVTYFPAILVMGIGMGITVAPLTTTVMSSAPSTASGTASGINNATARTAGVLAVAILGAFMLTLFPVRLNDRAAELDVPEYARGQMVADSANLAETAPPDGLTPEESAAANAAVDQAFVDVFGIIALIGAALAFISAGMAAALISGKQKIATAQAQVETAPTV
jgi:EmrB/QacA subfamily drug resistance transporter